MRKSVWAGLFGGALLLVIISIFLAVSPASALTVNGGTTFTSTATASSILAEPEDGDDAEDSDEGDEEDGKKKKRNYVPAIAGGGLLATLGGYLIWLRRARKAYKAGRNVPKLYRWWRKWLDRKRDTNR